MKSHTPALGFIFVTVVLDVLGFAIIIPVAPRLVLSFLGEDGTMGQAAEYGSYLAATYAAMQLLFAPTLGALSDRFGRRPVLLLSMLGSGLDYFAMALAPTLSFFFVTRVLNGISGATVTVASAYIADITPPEKRAAGFGIIGAAFGVGFMLGPLLGGFLGAYDERLPFYVAGSLALVNWLYGLFVLPESLPPERRAPLSLARLNPVGVFAHVLRYPLVVGLAIALFFLNMAQFALHNTWVLYTAFRYQFGPIAVGVSLFLVGLGAAIVQGFLAKKIIPRLGPSVLGERRAVLVGIAIGICAYVGYGLATDGWMIYALVTIASLGGIAQPAAQALITRSVLPTEQGATQGAITSLMSIANIVGPIAGGAAFAYGTAADTPPPLDLPGLSYFMSAALALVGGVIAWFATRRIVNAARAQAATPIAPPIIAAAPIEARASES